MTKSIWHLSLDIRGFLMLHERKRDFQGLFYNEDGSRMKSHEAKMHLLNELASGKRLLPLSEECVGFDFQTGCPGHEENEESRES